MCHDRLAHHSQMGVREWPQSSAPSTLSGSMRRCSPVRARSDVSGGRPRSSTSAEARYSTSSLIATPTGRAAGSPSGPSRLGPRVNALDLMAGQPTLPVAEGGWRRVHELTPKRSLAGGTDPATSDSYSKGQADV